MAFQKKSYVINTSRGHTYCEVYEPLEVPFDFKNCDATATDSGTTVGSQKESQTPETVLMVHGLGGTVRHWADSELPDALARRGCVAVCFDFYSHGKSTQLDSNMSAQPLLLLMLLPQLPLYRRHSNYTIVVVYHRRCMSMVSLLIS